MYPENNTPPNQGGDGCGTLPQAAPLAVPYVPYQQSGSQRYSHTDALNNGTLYPGLNLPFRVKATASALPQTAMTELQALEFVTQELALYLDTHPTDAEAFVLFQQYTALAREVRGGYTAQFGPVSRAEAAQNKVYTWSKGPWPWNYQEEGAR